MRGANATMRAFWPRLAAGLVGDLFHPVIQLGYAFESGDAELIAQGPSSPKPAPRSWRCALLTPQVNPGSFYRCGKRT